VKRAVKSLLTALGVLAVASALLAAGILLLGQRENVEPGHLLVEGMVGNGGVIDIDDLRAMGEVEIRMALLGTGEDGREHGYRGIPLQVLVQGSEPDPNATKVTVTAQDGYSKTFDIGDLDDAFIVWEKDGRQIPPRSRAGDGPIRLIISQEKVGTYNAQHCVKWVSGVIVE